MYWNILRIHLLGDNGALSLHVNVFSVEIVAAVLANFSIELGVKYMQPQIEAGDWCLRCVAAAFLHMGPPETSPHLLPNILGPPWLRATWGRLTPGEHETLALENERLRRENELYAERLRSLNPEEK